MSMDRLNTLAERGLYDPFTERANCGVGLVASLRGVKSHDIIHKALEILVNLEHRGACGCDPETGDGAGVLLQVPDTMFRRTVAADLPPEGEYGVGMVFLPRDPAERRICEAIVARVVSDEELQLLAWRDVPV